MIEGGNDRYLQEFHELMVMPTAIFADITAIFVRDPVRTPSKTAQMRKLLESHPDHVGCHRLAVEAGLGGLVDSLLRDAIVAEMVDSTNRLNRRSAALRSAGPSPARLRTE